LADSKDVDTLSTELESRLDDLFGENNIPLPDAEDGDLAAHYPLAELKNLILSIDWEITDDILEKFLQQLKDLKLTYKHDKIVLTFLQILNSLGYYIKTNRAQSHPKTFKILNSVFANLDKVVLSRDMPETAKKKILRTEMNRYKELRTQISKGKTAAKRKAPVKPAEPEKRPVEEIEEEQPVTLTEPSVQPSAAAITESPVLDQGQEPDVVTLQEPSVETLAGAVEELKKYIHDEINALKKEIRSLREQ
jgi:HAMP domain-containing protein